MAASAIENRIIRLVPKPERPVETGLPVTLEIARGLPPFVDARQFVLVEEKDAPPFLRIRCLTMDLSYVLIDPFIVEQDYAPEFSDADLAELQIGPALNPQVLAIVNFSRGPGNVTLNLSGPLLVNPATWHAKQVVLENALKYSTRHPLKGS